MFKNLHKKTINDKIFINYFIKESVVKKLEEKNTKKSGGVLVVLLILALIIIAVMGFFTYKLYNEKTKETDKSTELQTKVNTLNETVTDLQEKMNTISETISSKDSENTTSNKDKKTSLLDTEIKKAIQDCLDLESAKSNGPGMNLETLGFYKDGSESEQEQPAEKSGFKKTTIKYNEFKNKMLEYMTKECYEKQWGDIYSNENGYLCYDDIGETGIQYKVNSIEKTTDGYIANVTASSEGPDIEKEVNFQINDDGKIESYEIK